MEQEPGTQGASLTPDDRLMAVWIDIADQTVKAGTPKPLLKVRIGAPRDSSTSSRATVDS